MTIQQKRRILRQYKYILIEIDRLLEERAQWRARAEKITPSYSNVVAGGNFSNSRIETAEEKIQEIDEEIDKQLKIQKENRNIILSSINNLDDDKLRELLLHKYININNDEVIAEKLGYKDARYVRTKEVIALNKLNLNIYDNP